MIECHVLSQYPISRGFALEIIERLGAEPKFSNLTGAAVGSVRGIWTMLRAIRAKRVIVAIEDGGSAATAPILQAFAALTRGTDLLTIIPGDEPRAFSRTRALGATAALVARSIAAVGTVLLSWIRLAQLRRAARIEPIHPEAPRCFYLNANLWFGVKAGGSVGHISGVVNGLSGRGYQVTFASAGGRLLVDDRATFLPLPSLSGFAFPPEANCYVFARRILRAILRITSSTEFGFVYQRLSLGNWAGVEASRSARLPLICEYNGSEAWVAKHWGRPLKYHRLAILAETVVLRHSHLVVTVSDVLRNELVERGVSPERIVMYPNCIDPTLFDPARFSPADNAALRLRYGIPADCIVATFIGTFGQWHGAEVLAEAIREMLNSDPSWLERRRIRFLLVGDGAKMARVREILNHPLAARFVIIAGLVPQAEAPAHLAASDILFSPHVGNPDGTRFFGSPTKLFEYMAMGRAIVASDLDQIGDVLRNSFDVRDLPTADPDPDDARLAVLTTPGSAVDLIRAFRFLVESDNWRACLGRNARIEALARYTWDEHVRQILAGLSKVREQ